MPGRGRIPAPRSCANRPEVIQRRTEIVGRFKAGQHLKQISREMGIHIKTVRLWVRREEEEGHVKTRARPGRPPVTSPEDDRRLLAAAEQSPKKTTVALSRELHLQCHVSTLRRRLHNAGRDCYVPASKEELTENHRASRLQFARRFANADQEFWRSVIFTDETNFSSMSSRERHCWRCRGTRFSRENISERGKSGRVSLALYGWMWYGGVGELVPINGNLNSEEYINILETSLLPSVRAYALPEPLQIILVQDRSPIHTSRVVREWFANRPEIELIDWPTKGCDMNPIENLWGMMKQEWGVEEKTKASIERKTMEVWEGFRRRPNICSSLVDSMPSRLQEVIQANGGWTRY